MNGPVTRSQKCKLDPSRGSTHVHGPVTRSQECKLYPSQGPQNVHGAVTRSQKCNSARHKVPTNHIRLLLLLLLRLFSAPPAPPKQRPTFSGPIELRRGPFGAGPAKGGCGSSFDTAFFGAGPVERGLGSSFNTAPSGPVLPKGTWVEIRYSPFRGRAGHLGCGSSFDTAFLGAAPIKGGPDMAASKLARTQRGNSFCSQRLVFRSPLKRPGI